MPTKLQVQQKIRKRRDDAIESWQRYLYRWYYEDGLTRYLKYKHKLTRETYQIIFEVYLSHYPTMYTLPPIEDEDQQYVTEYFS